MNNPEQDIESSGAEAEYRVEDQIGFVLRKVHQRASVIFERVMREFKVTPMQFTLLVKLDDMGDVSQNQLGRLAAMDPATTFGVINRLKKRDLVQQRSDPNDGRRVILTLTEKGQAKISAMRGKAVEVSAQTLAPLDPEDRTHLLNLLSKLI